MIFRTERQLEKELNIKINDFDFRNQLDYIIDLNNKCDLSVSVDDENNTKQLLFELEDEIDESITEVYLFFLIKEIKYQGEVIEYYEFNDYDVFLEKEDLEDNFILIDINLAYRMLKYQEKMIK